MWRCHTLSRNLATPPPSERVAKPMRSPVAQKIMDLDPLSADLIPVRKPDGPPCRVVVNRDPFR